MDHYGFLLNLKLYFVNSKLGVTLMESMIRNRKKVYSVGNILTQTEINLSCMLENYEKCMHRVEVVHTYDNQDLSRFFLS